MPEGKRKKCNCNVCKQSATIKKVLRGRNVKAMRGMIEHLFGELIQAQEDNGYYEAIIGGSWHSAVEQLECALNRAKQYAALTAAGEGA